MRVLRLAAVMLAVLCCAALWCTPAGAEDYSVTIMGNNGDGLGSAWIYEFTNTSTNPSLYLWYISITVDEGLTLISHSEPKYPGWVFDDSAELPNVASWVCYGNDGIAPGNKLDGFKAVFDSTPKNQEYTAMLNNVVTYEAPVVNGLVTVPEPAGISALLIGIPTLMAFARRRRA